MKRFCYRAILISVCLMFSFVVSGCVPAEDPQPDVKGYAHVNDIQLYYEMYGSGEPLILLHGGFSNLDYWNNQILAFAEQYQVIAVDSRGHGRSTDGDCPITYSLMASDVLALMDSLGIQKANFVGWSDGAVIALILSITAPDRVDKAVLNGVNITSQRTYIPIYQELLNNEPLFNWTQTLLFSAEYKSLNPDPDHWDVFLDKMYSMWTTECYIEHDEDEDCFAPLQDITAKTLLIAGANEFIKISHTRAIHEAIPGSELIIVPYASHFLAEERPDVFNEAVLEFLEK